MGLDELGAFRVDLDLPAQATHLVVDTAIEHLRSAAGGEIEELVATQHDADMIDERAQQPKLAGAEGHGHAILAEQLAAAHVQGPAIELNRARARPTPWWQAMRPP